MSRDDDKIQVFGATFAEYDRALAEYWRKNPKATDADVRRFQASWGPLYRNEEEWRNPTLYGKKAAAAAVAAKDCGANGMTIWHWLFMLLLVALVIFLPRVVAYIRSRRESSKLLGVDGALEPVAAHRN